MPQWTGRVALYCGFVTFGLVISYIADGQWRRNGNMIPPGSAALADGCGVAITGGENITVENAGWNEQTLQCTLDTKFLKMFNIGYQSRAKFFRVQKTSASLH